MIRLIRQNFITIIIFTLLISSSLIANEIEESTNVRNSIIRSLSRNYQEYLGYQSSSVEMYRNYSNNRHATNAPELHFLGGEFNNHDIIVNGLSFRNPLTGVADVSLSTLFMDNIKIHNGNIPIQFSNTNSAVIELSSPYLKTGIHGSFETLSDNIVGNKFDQNYYRGIFSGSHPTYDKLKFWTAFERKWLGDRMPSSFTSEILSGNPDILPNNQLSGWTYHGKLQYELASSSLITITADGSNDEWQEYLHYFNNPSQPNQIAHTPRSKDETFGINALFEQKLSENTNFNFSYGYYKSEHINGDGVLFDNYEAYNRGPGIANPRNDVHSLFKEGDSLYITVIDSITDPANPDTSEVFSEFREAYYDNFLKHISSYKQLRGETNHTYLDVHTITSGFLFKKYTLRYFSDLGPSQGFVQQNINRYGFDSLGNESDNESFKNNTKHPTELSFYLSDKMSFDRITINAGLRLNRFDFDASRIKNPERPFDPDGSNPSDHTIDETDVVEVETQTSLNPHVGLDVQLSENTNIYLNWSKNHQIAPYNNMYVGYDFVEARIGGGFYSVLPNSTIEPVKSKSLVYGYTVKSANKISFEANIFDVDYEKQVGDVWISPSIPFSFATLDNIGSSSYFGANILLQYDNRKNFSGFVDITNSKAKGNNIRYSSSILWKNSQGTPNPEFPLDYDRINKIVAGASFETNFGLKINLIAKQESGYPYTPMMPYDAVTFSSVDQFPTGTINSARTDKIRTVDLKLEKDFKFTKQTITAFILVKNLFDEEFITGVYPGTSSPTNTGFLDTPPGQRNVLDNGDEYLDRYNFAQANPLNFYAPRQIFFGLKASF